MKYLLLITLAYFAASCSGNELDNSKDSNSPIITTPNQTRQIVSENENIKPEEKITDGFPAYVEKAKEFVADSFLIDNRYAIYGDFNADSKEDFASIITNLKNKKQGVIIIHNTATVNYQVFGAGKVVDGMDDLDWIDTFESIPKGEKVMATLVNSKSGDIIGPDKSSAFTLAGNGIYMHVDESEGGGIIYWNGREYEWLHLE